MNNIEEVAKAFVPNPDSKSEVNHINGIKANNAASNLEWATRRENHEHARARGLLASGDRSGARKHPETIARGSASPVAKFTEAAVAEVRRMVAVGYTDAEIAAVFNVTAGAVWAVRKGKTWRHVA